jgi:mono/diheme cytochrome c family protein
MPNDRENILSTLCEKPLQTYDIMKRATYYVTLSLLACINGASFAADADNGSRLAQRWCASCHIVSGIQSKGTDTAPSFASMAQMTDVSAEKLAYFLLEPHPKMQDMSLSRDAAKDLAAYIAKQHR